MDRVITDFVKSLTGKYQELWAKFVGESCFESFAESRDFVDGRAYGLSLKKTSNMVPKTKLAKILGSPYNFRRRKCLDNETGLQLV